MTTRLLLFISLLALAACSVEQDPIEISATHGFVMKGCTLKPDCTTRRNDNSPSGTICPSIQEGPNTYTITCKP